MAEKRYQYRHKKRLKVRFGLEQTKKMAFTSDLSAGGVFVSTGNPEPPGTHVQLELSLPHHDAILAIGQVRWAKKVPANLFHVAKKGRAWVFRLKSLRKARQLFLIIWNHSKLNE